MTWEELKKVFLQKYFPMNKSVKLRNEISKFIWLEQEQLYEAWERYMDVLRCCPQHQLPKWMIVQTFCNVLHPNTQTMIDAASGGSMNNKKPDEMYDLIEAMTSNNYERGSGYLKNGAEIIDID